MTDTERLDKLEAVIKNCKGDGLALQFDDSCTNQWMINYLEWQSGADGWSGGIGIGDEITRYNLTLREVIDKLSEAE